MDLNSANLELKKISTYIDFLVLGHINKGTWESLALCLELRKLHTDENIHNLMNTLILIKIEVSFGFKIVI